MDCHGKNNVLIIVENLPLPFDRRVWQEANTLKRAGFGVFIICPKGKDQYNKEYEEINGIKIYRHRLPFEANNAVGYLIEYLTALYWEKKLAKKIFKEYGFNYIQACNPPDLIYLIAKPYKKKYGVKFIFDHHDINPELYLAKFNRKDIFYWLLMMFEKNTFKLADHCIATNKSYKEIALNRGKKDEDEVTVVRSGPSLERLYYMPPNDELKKGREYLICYVGVIGQQEGIEYLLDAARILKEKGRRDVFFLIMGQGPQWRNMVELSIKMGIDEMVDFPGRVSDDFLRTALSTADICINPDKYNEMNDKSTMNKIMEYMAMGKPIIQFDLTEGRYSAKNASLYALKNNPDDMARKIIELLNDPDKRKRMGDFGKKRVIDKLEWTHEESKYLSVYERMKE
ncbi:MAG: glycosyltransferase family 4 protein [Eubacteriales bacterium]